MRKTQLNWWESYEEIEWRAKGTFCYDCGLSISKEQLEKHKDYFEFFEDGHVRHKNCNFN